MKKVILLFTILTTFSYAQVTGLNNWTIFVDPGHSRTENMGIYNYSEAEKVLRIGLYVEHLLRSKTDIKDVFLSRRSDNDQVSLSQRTNMANSLNADWYHSIHSNAGSVNSNSTLLLWGQYKNGKEKVPNGGNAMSDIMIDIYTRAMRTYTVKGSIGDCTFYGCSFNGPYLHVNRNSNMPSELSEGGYHTNPAQNQRNMNAEWKRIEAYAIFWTILQYHNKPRPRVDVVTGIVRDAESGKPLNGATITIEDTTYTTDTYASLFHKYTTDPELLSNGFYYLDGFNTDSVTITVSAENYISQTRKVAMIDTFFTYADFEMISDQPPFVKQSVPEQNAQAYLNLEEIELHFSRPMDKQSVENALSITPQAPLFYSWSENAKTVRIETQLAVDSDYTVTLLATAKDNYNHFLDGNNDGTAGDAYTLTFKTGQDTDAPQVIEKTPLHTSKEQSLTPLIQFIYNEPLIEDSSAHQLFQLRESPSEAIQPGSVEHHNLAGTSVVTFFPENNLTPQTLYFVVMNEGLKDLYDNATTSKTISYFSTGNVEEIITKIDDFNSSVESNWWPPQSSGSTRGVDSGTKRKGQNKVTNQLFKKGGALNISYDWNLNDNSWLLREYLGGGAPRNVTFAADKVLRLYIFGDGSGTQFRFALDEGSSASSWKTHEVSQWYTIDWFGWKAVEWDLTDPGQTGNWIGNGKLDNSHYRFDSIQLQYNQSAKSGELYFDDLILVEEQTITAITDKNKYVPQQFHLEQNYPNPFNPSTTIPYKLAENGHVILDIFNSMGQKVTTLVNKQQAAGKYKVYFNAHNYAAGTYAIRLRVGQHAFIRKMTLIK